MATNTGLDKIIYTKIRQIETFEKENYVSEESKNLHFTNLESDFYFRDYSPPNLTFIESTTKRNNLTKFVMDFYEALKNQIRSIRDQVDLIKAQIEERDYSVFKEKMCSDFENRAGIFLSNFNINYFKLKTE